MNEQKSTRKLAIKLVSVTLVMFMFGFGLVPLYDVICDVTGLNGKTGTISEAQVKKQQVDPSRQITVEFIANLNQSMNWDFKPVIAQLEVNPGEIYEVNYLARNRNAKITAGHAVPSTAPLEAARFFNKIECFCFTRQVLEPGEERLMPARFVVDPDLPEHINTISLSYTFFDVTDKPPADRT